ncbi:Telomere repeat-binding factor 5 isoform D [Glycine soja]|uniref:MYB transcription factor n=1 Tax=Glycine soja TaxID=3848 RepID=A0A445JGS8_GLYSO|nr:Telomere repeat-binding factor 5 isoform D [Glycine soja]
MGNQKQKWTQDEEDALIAGVEKHGPGKWKNILKDPQFAPFLTSRSNIDLKDKWRNLSVSNGAQGSKEKSRVPKLKALPAPPAPTATPQNAAPALQNAASDVTPPDASQNDQDAKNPPSFSRRYFEASPFSSSSATLRPPPPHVPMLAIGGEPQGCVVVEDVFSGEETGALATTTSFLVKHSWNRVWEETTTMRREPNHREMMWPYLLERALKVRWRGRLRWWRLPIMGRDGGPGGRYNAMIFEALSALKDSNGSDMNAIIKFMEVQNGYKVKKEASSGTKSPSPKPKDVRPPQPQQQSPASVLMTNDTIKEAADTAAYRVADAESKSYLAAEAVKEAEKISLLVEHSDSMLQLAKDIYEQCSRGEIILLA